MLPKHHVAASIAIALLAAILLRHEPISWVLAAVIVTIAMDLDHILAFVLYPEKKKLLLKAPYYLTHIEELRDRLHSKGYSFIRLGTHLLWGGVMVTLTRLYLGSLFDPVTLSLLSHLALDVAEWLMYPALR